MALEPGITPGGTALSTKPYVAPTPAATSNPNDPGMDLSARQQLVDTLNQVGLGDWADFAWTEHLKGVPAAQILVDIRGTDLYKQKFPGMDELRKQGVGWNEANYITYVKTARDALHFYGIPQGVFDTPQDLSKLMVGGVSTTEFETRIKEAAAAINTYSPEAKAELKRLYGVDEGGIIAYAMDPAKAEPILAQQFAAAKIAGISDTTGFGQLTQTQAEMLAKQGVTADQAQQGLGRLASESELTHGLIGQNEKDISVDTQLGAEFSGNATDQAALLARQRSRQAQFAGSSNVVTTNQGVVGLKSANT